MPVLRNARHERYAQERASGKSIDAAHAAAGFKPNRGNAARINAIESVQERIRELQSKVAEKAQWTAQDRMEALQAIYTRIAEADPRTAISAIAEANKMAGSYAPSKSELSGPDGGPIQVEQKSWRERLREEK